MLKYKKDADGNETIEELCEHCEEKVRDIHISDLACKVDGDGRTVKVRKADGETEITLDERAVKILKVKRAAASKSLWDDEHEADTDFTDELKYNLRAEALCSESIDSVQGYTSSFCYRVSHPKVLEKFGNTDGEATIFKNASDDSGGKKKGLRRLKKNETYSTADVVEKLKSEQRDDGEDEIEYPWSVTWVKESDDVVVDFVMSAEADCEEIRNMAGEARNYEDWRRNIYDRNCR